MAWSTSAARTARLQPQQQILVPRSILTLQTLFARKPRGPQHRRGMVPGMVCHRKWFLVHGVNQLLLVTGLVMHVVTADADVDYRPLLALMD